MLDRQLETSPTHRPRTSAEKRAWTPEARVGSAALLAIAGLASGCQGCEGASDVADAAIVVSSAEAGNFAEAGPTVELVPEVAQPEPELEPKAELCPRDMVLVDGRYCVDRYEATLVDVATERALSPYYPPSPKLASSLEKLWQTQRFAMGDPAAQALDLPVLPSWEKSKELQPEAVSARGAVPQGYVSGNLAELACKNAGKRLCTLDQWRTACRGERGKPFPYGDGDKYVAGKCNVFREAHPAMVLHGDFSVGHTDPRLNLVRVKDRSLLRTTGATSECVSEWGDDGIADMVGNVDEWIDDPEGTFVGGFYARATKDGCASTISTHSFDYYDYSTGIRCCRDLAR
jgi:formylglycine-generating enzyme required for sulfatase activity